MTKRLQSKHKAERRYGVFWENGKSPAHVRSYPAGQHGPKGVGKVTSYGQQLAVKQRLKGHYGNLSEKQFRKAYQEAVRVRGDTGENFLRLLERRLDAIVYRLRLAPTVFTARQFVSHKHILVNGRCVNIPSYRLKVGDVVSLSPDMRANAVVLQAQGDGRAVPEYLKYEDNGFAGALVYEPDVSKIPYPFEHKVSTVVELYAR